MNEEKTMSDYKPSDIQIKELEMFLRKAGYPSELKKYPMDFEKFAFYQSQINFLKGSMIALLEEVDQLKETIEYYSPTGFGKDEEGYRHDWKVVPPIGMYDDLYRCRTCGQENMESIDNPESTNPVYGCIPQ